MLMILKPHVKNFLDKLQENKGAKDHRDAYLP